MPLPATPSPRTALARIRRLRNLTVAGIWLYQGIVPKLLGPHPDEIAMSAAFGIPAAFQATVSHAAGAGEVLLGLCILAFPRRAWPQRHVPSEPSVRSPASTASIRCSGQLARRIAMSSEPCCSAWP